MSRTDKRDSTEEGFTLIELMLALALLSTSFLFLLYLRADAVERTGDYTQKRRIQKLAQEKLDEVTFGLEDDRSGTFKGPPEMQWETTIEDVSRTEKVFLECKIEITYTDAEKNEQTFTLTTWILPDENDPLLSEVDLKSEDGE